MGITETTGETSARPVEAGPADPPTPRRDRRDLVLDLGIALALAVVAWVIRRTGLPHDGLWHDDAWVATGAIHGNLREIFMAGSGHPGFVGGLMIVSRLTGGSSDAMAWPAFAAGVVGAPLLFLALRRFGYARSIASLCAAALVVADVHILYSTRVKTYAIDVLCVLALAVLLPRLARMTWTWATALGWFAFAVAIAFFSGFALVATAIAGAFLVVYARNDRWKRVTAVGAQAVAELFFYVEMQRSSDLTRIERQQEPFYDGHVSFSWNPIEFGDELLEHFRRVVNVYPGGPNWLLTVLVVVVIAGLAIAATNRRRAAEAIRAQYLALLLLFAIVAATLDKFPFGPKSMGFTFHSRGERSTMWLIPVLAVGLAAALQQFRRMTGGRRAARIGFDLVVGVLAMLVIFSALDERAPTYAFSGTKTATHVIERELDANDVVLLPGTSIYPYAVETDSEVTLRATPKRAVGYGPVFADARIVAVGAFGFVPPTPEGIGPIVEDADRVFVYDALPGYGSDTALLTDALTSTGFVLTETTDVKGRNINLWEPWDATE